MKKFWTQLSFSILLVGITVTLYVWDIGDIGGTTSERVWGGIAVSVWAFSIPPACVFANQWFKRKGPAEAARIGFIYGSVFEDFISLFIVPILISPVLMVRYYMGLFRGGN
jgi:uncharacterized protein YqgC (DUF456 family)